MWYRMLVDLHCMFPSTLTYVGGIQRKGAPTYTYGGDVAVYHSFGFTLYKSKLITDLQPSPEITPTVDDTWAHI